MIHRLSVNINDESADTLRRITAKRGITTTEAIRWAIGLLDYCEQADNATTEEPGWALNALENAARKAAAQLDEVGVWGMEDARRIVAGIPPLTDAQCDAAAVDYAQTRLGEVTDAVGALHAPYRCMDGEVVCRECSEPDGWDKADGPYLYPDVHLVDWPCRTARAIGDPQ